jgi:hypothetical protein
MGLLSRFRQNVIPCLDGVILFFEVVLVFYADVMVNRQRVRLLPSFI